MRSHVRRALQFQPPTVLIRNVLLVVRSTIGVVTGLLIGLVAGYFLGRWHLRRELWADRREILDIFTPLLKEINDLIGP